MKRIGFVTKCGCGKPQEDQQQHIQDTDSSTNPVSFILLEMFIFTVNFRKTRNTCLLNYINDKQQKDNKTVHLRTNSYQVFEIHTLLLYLSYFKSVSHLMYFAFQSFCGDSIGDTSQSTVGGNFLDIG